MPLKVRQSGAGALINRIHVMESSVLVPIQRGWVMQGGLLTKFYTSEVVVTLGNSADIVASDLFSPEDWGSSKDKRVIIPESVVIGATALAYAFCAPTDRGGRLLIENFGEIQGIGGLAGTSGAGGVGGNAFRADQAGTEIRNFGAIRAGGGGAGRGGAGGGGQYNYTYREPSSGWRFVNDNSGSMYMWMNYYDTDEDDNRDGYENTAILWSRNANNPTYNVVLSDSASSYTAGGWTYLKGPVNWSTDSQDRRGIARQQARTESTDGGSGGAGGRGQGFGQSRTLGGAGAPGGQNAGDGGEGGDGGLFGQNGGDGAPGENGNRTSGTAGSTGGLAGIALMNIANIDLTETGPVQGRIT